ncbi:MAG TPA: PQQ-binding-like beta-propeller repeat protein [Planctomycetota bacterium]|nr:PQQ-binding-like beta-propeller repeat protein [Planctomycetota bacterium]
MRHLRLVLPFCVAASSLIHGADWPQYRGPNRDGTSSESGWSAVWPKEGPRQLWKANVGTGSSPVTVSAGKVFTMGNSDGQDHVFCLDSANGKILWKHSYASERFDQMHEGGPASAPSVDGNLVYTMGRSGEVLCLDAATGQVKWSLNVVKEFKAELPFFAYTISPLVLGSKLIVITGAKGASTVALDKENGKVLWKSGDDPAAYASPVPFPEGKQTHVAIFNGAGLLILNVETGAEVARHPWDTPSPMNSRVNAASPVVTGTRAFIGSSYGMGCALVEFDLAAGKAKAVWQNDELTTQYNSALYYNKHLYGFHSHGQNDGSGELRCVNVADGKVLWSRKNPGLGSLICCGGKLIILTRGGELITAEASPEDYKELARVQITGSLCRNEPTLSDGKLYVRTSRGDVHCMDVSAAKE